MDSSDGAEERHSTSPESVLSNGFKREKRTGRTVNITHYDPEISKPKIFCSGGCEPDVVIGARWRRRGKAIESMHEGPKRDALVIQPEFQLDVTGSP